MNVNEMFKKYLDVTDDVLAAASLTLAETNMLLCNQQTLVFDESCKLTDIKRKPSIPGMSEVISSPLTVPEAAALLNVGESTIRDMCASGRLPHVRVGNGRGTIRIRRADVVEFQNSVTRKAPKTKPAMVADRVAALRVKQPR